MEIIDNRFRVIKKIYNSEIADTYLTEDIDNNDKLVDVMPDPHKSIRKSKMWRYKNKITERELQVAKLLVHEMSNREIADVLSIGLRTVETHRRNILKKLKINSMYEVVSMAIEKSWFY